MATSIGMTDEVAIWNRIIQFDKQSSPTAARALLELQFSEADKQRMRELAAKARAGTLAAEEERLMEIYEHSGCVLDILHSKARGVLKLRPSDL